MPLADVFGDKVEFVLQEGLMEYMNRDRLQMTQKGKRYYGGVLALFYAPHIQQHLLQLPGGEMLAVSEEAHAQALARPYEGNPVARYEYRPRRAPADPRPMLSGDWAVST